MQNFSHLNKDGKPEMVDVSDKAVTAREAVARATVILGQDILAALRHDGFITKKGSIVQTAVIAGTMAVKRTADVIPLCHNIPISSVKISIEEDIGPAVLREGAMTIECRVRTTGQTGVEMEALHGASVAALTIYDMCKSRSHAIRIEGLHLVSKRGGKSDFG